MLSAGTLPQIGGTRMCSIHARGNCLDPVIAAVTAGRRYRHVVGFENGESSRAIKDALFNNDRRTGWYPLREWGWDRARCVDFIARVTSRQWTKSACGLCPFAMRTDSGRQAVVGERRIGVDGVTRQVLRERGEQLPALEHFFVVCPAVVEDKARPGFEAWWQEATNDAVLF